MKNLFWLTLACLSITTASCNFFNTKVKITGQLSAVTDGTVSFLNSDKKGFTARIINGKFNVNQKLEEPGYYHMIVGEDNAPTSMIRQLGHEIYLEPGDYTITDSRHKYSSYPTIVSTSDLQNSLSKYRPLEDSAIQVMRNNALQRGFARHSADTDSAFYQFKTRMAEINAEDAGVRASVIKQFARQNPGDKLVAHIIATSTYKFAPTVYQKLIRDLDPKLLDTEEGKQAVADINILANLAPGAAVPAILGTSPGGKKVDLKRLNKDLIVVEFWSARSASSRLNHQMLQSTIIPKIDTAKVGVLSISVDEKLGWWIDAIREDKLTWPQVNDLKGSDSPNVYNWGVTKIPTYYLVTGKGKMVCQIVVPAQLKKEIDIYYKFIENE